MRSTDRAMANPFHKLAALREGLPPGEPPKDAPAHGAKAAPRLFLEKVVVRKVRKGHGGKTVTVIAGIAPAFLEPMCGELKRALGCGARVEDGAVVVQGELVERAVAFLERKGATKVIRGG